MPRRYERLNGPDWVVNVQGSLIVPQVEDANENEVLKFGSTTSAVNEVTVTNAATATSPVVGGTGGDTNVGLRLDAKGTAYVHTSDPLVKNTSVTTNTTAGALTITAAMLLGGILARDPNGAGRTDVLPTAALLVAAIPGAAVGDTVECLIVNTADAAETITLNAGSGGTLVGAGTIAQNAQRLVLVRLTNVTASSEAYVAYC